MSWLRYDGQWYYEYDKSGNRTVRAKGLLPGSFGSEAADTSQEYWDYGWDLYNRLVSVKRNGQQIASYAYDTENYRVQRVGSDGTTVYGYDGNGSLTYQRSLTSGVRRSIVYLKGEVIGWTESVGGTSTRYYAETDQLGSVTQVLDQGGSVAWQSEYTAFGTVAGAQGSVVFSGMFAGKDFDSDTGLSYYWNRWRSEDGSRFISEDPAGDGINWYAYCNNNPLAYIDPTGLADTPFGSDITYGAMTDTTNEQVDEARQQQEKRNNNTALSSPTKTSTPKPQEDQNVWDRLQQLFSWENVELGIQAAVNFDFGQDQRRWSSGDWKQQQYLSAVMVYAGGLAEAGLDTLAIVALIYPDIMDNGIPDTAATILNKVNTITAGGGSVWLMNPFERGRMIEKDLGMNLPNSFPTIDRFDNGVATSIKSLDLGAASYQNASGLSSTIRGYINSVAGFNGAAREGYVIRSSEITGRALDLAIPNTGNAIQQRVLQQMVQYGQNAGVNVNLVVYP